MVNQKTLIADWIKINISNAVSADKRFKQHHGTLIPLTRASDLEFWYGLCCLSEQDVKQTADLSVILRRHDTRVTMTIAAELLRSSVVKIYWTKQGLGLLKLRSLISPLVNISILQMNLFDYLHHIHIWQVSP